MAVRKANRYAPALGTSPVTPRPRRWMVLGSANVLELDGALSPELSFTLFMDAATRSTRNGALDVDAQVQIKNLWLVDAELSLRVWRPGELQTDIAVRLVRPLARDFDGALHVTGTASLQADLRQAARSPFGLNAEAAPRIYAVLRREDHLILT